MVDMLCERDPDILAEHAAEIVAVEAKYIRDLLEGQGLHVVLVDIGDNFPDPELVAAGFRKILLVKHDREVLDQPVEDVQRDRLCGDHVALGLLDVQRHQFLEAVADLQIGGDKFVGQLRAAADDLEIALVAHQSLDQIVVETKNDHHVGMGAASLVDLIGVGHDELTGHKLVLGSLQEVIGVTVQNIDEFKGIVPMGGEIISGRPVLNEDSLLVDIISLFVEFVRHMNSFRYLLQFIILRRRAQEIKICYKNNKMSKKT